MREMDTSKLGPIKIDTDPPFQRYGKQVRHMGQHFCDAVDEVSAMMIEQALNRAETLRKAHEPLTIYGS